MVIWMMIYNALELNLNTGEIISVVGGGGKTTTIFQLAKELKTLDKKFYQHWQNMRTRTTNSKYEYYHRYGGRGINSDDFIYFIDFYDALYKSYLEHINIYGVENTTLERKDTNDNYSKDNCIWATWNIQHSNTSKNKYFKAISPDNKEYISKNQCEFARRHNLSSKQINACLNGRFKTHLGWRFEYIK